MIIGLNGPKGSGKSEVASILEKNYGFKAIGFADKLKESAAALFPGLPAEYWDYLKNEDTARVSLEWREYHDGTEFYREISIDARTFLQRYGTESHRDILGYDIWVDVLIGSLTAQDDVAIGDARFDNELSRIKQHRGINIQVRRPGYEFDPSHLSEAPPRDELIDYVIPNNGNLGDLSYEVTRFIEWAESEKLLSPRQSVLTDSLSPLLSQPPAQDSSPLNVS